MPPTLPRHAEIWLPDYVRSVVRAARARAGVRGVTDILLAITDHYEPLHGKVTESAGTTRVDAWLRRYPGLAREFVDADGRPPQHTFFFPIEEYRIGYLDRLGEICRGGFGEVEIHLHHDNDTPENLAASLSEFASRLHERHGFLPRDAAGRLRYGFIHGNWALDNCRPDRRRCGVNGELAVLADTGCYADFTNPAAPSPAQTRTVNQIYYASTTAPSPKAHDRGVRAGVGRRPSAESLLMVQGPLGLSWRHAKWGLAPRLETGALDGGAPATLARFAEWVSAGVTVEGRPDWVFVKVHTHGAPEKNAEVLLGPAMAAFHRAIGTAFNDGRRYRLHYVTAREMVNIIHAAEDGKTGNPGLFRDYRYPRPPASGSAGHAAVQ